MPKKITIKYEQAIDPDADVPKWEYLGSLARVEQTVAELVPHIKDYCNAVGSNPALIAALLLDWRRIRIEGNGNSFRFSLV